MTQVRKIKWLIAHEPVELFLRTAQAFAEEVRNSTDGAIDIEILTATEYATKFNNGVKENPMVYMDRGELEMSQLHISQLWKYNAPAFMALEMPFLFSDHDHATRVLEGNIGQDMLLNLKEKSPARGLAFTYSGGFRIVPSKQAVERLEDFYRMNIGCGNNPVAQDTFAAVGANPVPMYIEDLESYLQAGRVDGGETTYTRYFVLGHDKQTNYINDNEHSLFLTSLIINKQAWQAMGERVQGIFARAALRAAQIERDESLADNVVIQQRAAEVGIPTVRMTAKEKARFVSATEGLYTKFNTYFSPGLLSQLTQNRR